METDEYKTMFEAEGSHWWYVSLHRLILNHVKNEYTSKGPLDILDAGCGTGRLMELMNEYGRVSGVDISPTAIAFCKERGLENATQADINSFSTAPGSFDIITSIDVLYHNTIVDETAIIRKFQTMLKPGGLLILNLPAFDFLKSVHDVKTHTRKRYIIGELKNILSGCGFDIEKSTYRVFILFPIIAVLRILKKLIHRHGEMIICPPRSKRLRA